MEQYIQPHTLLMILCGIGMGTIARLITLHIDTRQTPSFPNGMFISIFLGFVASFLGAVAIPALLAQDLTAVTFLTLGVQHFREVRTAERESMEKLESTEFTKRGNAYIDGIAKTYESRYYISLITALLVVLALELLGREEPLLNIGVSLAVGFAAIALLRVLTKGKCVGDICRIVQGRMTVEGSELYVDGMFVTNKLGTERSRELFLREGVAFVITPSQKKFEITLNNYGQRQALLFEATRTFGVKRFAFSRKSFTQGKVVVAFVPILNQPDAILEVLRRTPVLENSRKIHTIMKSPVIGGNAHG
ncbi:YIEGIA domain-containing protein [Lawsonibacter faecis]|jgi:hypothetical protein|uniref:YIEGIA domain-containing protein n=1 Tax=Lawsonibacter faecis TaxID=2763052 RepID=A0A8J6JLE6_9FIRM|nr:MULTISPECIES: YIEGIA domain-containing protein [Oscillospiraceae]MTQ95640.1 YIEGIA protein [Pseudoflavonifractor sp. BIOML-A16]MTR06022.1 YIEGIA protein [Pseudoflavonifractor sp. BIOML-A15]MTR32102.1 YIEGIA protein [Pseudoflavonifractor sp. BIOML-A14]MTR73064.1 YIEGIA protein [Pseudoflavonifractor sp. BIOML-A18]MTS63713.1 YIEGIA protein [Pseudoflavonifractor sp. BIOML-A5]MTS71331.1 YIEGIA protein [Pseudoflavonifractor sp. BIOML-A8]MTS91564.1 YIEGIA protein [Pseudoflavonifractor sp. BIOML-